MASRLIVTLALVLLFAACSSPATPAWAPDVDTSIAAPPNASLEDMPIVEVTGMYDHPAARTCRNRLDHDDPEFTEPDPAVTILECRWTFVVTSMQKVEE